MWSRRIALFAALLFIVGAVAHRSGLLETPPFLSLMVLIAVLAIFALLCAAWGFSRLWRFGDRGGRASAWGVLVALIVLTPFLWAALKVATKPFLAGVSTDTAAPPDFSAALQARDAAMNPIAPISEAEASLQEEHYLDVSGRRYETSPDQVVQAIETLIEARGWTVLARRGASELSLQTTIEALARTPLLGFPSDVAIRITDEGSATFVDMRSISRYGRHDLGANASRITAFMADLDAAMMTLTAQQ